MKAKLMLSIDDNIIRAANEYAGGKGESLSVIVENYLKSITAKKESNPVISDKVRKMMGVISLPDNFEYKKELARAVAQKRVDRL
jgi:hypothetical protein